MTAPLQIQRGGPTVSLKKANTSRINYTGMVMILWVYRSHAPNTKEPTVSGTTSGWWEEQMRKGNLDANYGSSNNSVVVKWRIVI